MIRVTREPATPVDRRPRITSCDVAIVGAGPYGLAAAAHLRGLDRLDVRIFGEPMSFWDAMPRGLLLRAPAEIASPHPDLTLRSYEKANGTALQRPAPLAEFIRYGRWFQQRAVPEVDHRRVSLVTWVDGGFELELDDGRSLAATRVMIAAGMESFAFRPPLFDAFPAALVSHSSDEHDLGRFADARIVVIGGGQSALESAALLHESGAAVEVIARSERLEWLRGGSRRPTGWLVPVNIPEDVGPPGLRRLAASPRTFHRLPRSLQERLACRTSRPAGARWLMPRLKRVPIVMRRSVVGAATTKGRVQIVLDDDSVQIADHVILATGYRVDIAAYGFLSPMLLGQIAQTDGYPLLHAGLESSVAGLHFLGAPAAWSFGPMMRFVSGSSFAARALLKRVL